MWICHRLSNDLCYEEICHPIELFQFMIHEGELSWGHYAVYITWLNQHFRFTYGCEVFNYLKKHKSKNMYSFWYLVGQYYGHKIICLICRSFRIRNVGRCCQICQNAQDSSVPCKEGTSMSTELHSTQTKTSTG